MTFLNRLADRLILQPTTHAIDPEDRRRISVAAPTGNVDVWSMKTFAKTETPDNQCVLLKFPGTGGRAERSGPFPANLWESLATDIWTVNHRGYGESDGPATLQNFMETCDAVWGFAKETFPDRKIVVSGNSLGCISALYLSARYKPDGVYLRNPPPLADLIATMPKYAWPSLGMSRVIASQVPKELDAIENARLSTCPALLISSELDRVVPAKYQDMILEAYGGLTKRFVIQGADHHHSIPDSQADQYVLDCQWLENLVLRVV